MHRSGSGVLVMSDESNAFLLSLLPDHLQVRQGRSIKFPTQSSVKPRGVVSAMSCQINRRCEACVKMKTGGFCLTMMDERIRMR